MSGLLIIPCCYSPVFFKLANKALNNITLFISVTVYFRPVFAVFPKGNYRFQSGIFNLTTQCVAVIPFVAHDHLSAMRYGLSGKFGSILMVA